MTTTGSGNTRPRFFTYCEICLKKGVYKSGYVDKLDNIVKYEKCRYCEYIKEIK